MHEQTNAGSGQAAASQSARLDSWKEIASYLKRDIRTVQRWEKEEGLPVHRLPHKKRGSVFAHREEIDYWWSRRGGLLDNEAPGEAKSSIKEPRRRILWLASVGAVLLGGATIAWLWGTNSAHNAHSAGPVRITASSPEVRALYAKGFSFLWFEREPDGALELFSEAWRLDPNCASCGMHLAWAKFSARHAAAEYQPIADKSLQLSETLPLDERFMNRGLFYEIAGDKEKALGAYKGLAELHPDDTWAVTAVTYTLLNLGRVVETASYWARLAELRPDNFEANVKAGCLYYEMGGDETRAAPFIKRAQALAPSVSVTDMGRVWIELFPAFEAWSQGNVLQAEHYLGTAEQLYVTGKEANWISLIQQAGLFHMALGQFDQAERWYNRVQDDRSRSMYLLRMAFARSQERTVLRLTDSKTVLPLRTWEPPLLRAWFSPDGQAEALIEERMKANLDQKGLYIAQGVLAHAQGRTSDAISLLRRGLPLIPDAGWGVMIGLSLGSETLAAALEKDGDTAGAIKVLEAVRRRKHQNFGFGGHLGYYWIRSQVPLVRLYKKAGREEDARNLGSELLRLLNRADENNPMLLELKDLMKTTG